MPSDDILEEQILRDLEGIDLDDHDIVKEGDSGSDPIVIKVADDQMKAYANVQPPLDSGQDLGRDDVLAELKKNNVTYGIDDEAIDEIFSYGTYNIDVVVAKGTLPTNGTPSRIEYKFDTSNEKKVELKEDEHGNVDHKSVGRITSVEEGELLAVKIPAVPGEKGMTVTAKELPAKEGTDLALPLGENVTATDDGLGIVAAITGQPFIRDNRVSVSPVYKVNGDVNYKSGNIDFKGTVIVTGNVNSDFEVKATTDIEIHGNIEKAFISAGGDVRIKGGLYGANEGKITAGGDISIRSVDAGILEAGGNITIGQQARMSTLMAGKDIILNNPKGSIVGGKATAAHHFIVSNLGSTSFTDTIIEIGINPKLKKAHEELEKRIEERKDRYSTITTHIKTIKEKQKQGMDPAKSKAMLAKLVPVYHKLRAGLEDDLKKLKYLDAKLGELTGGKARVKGTTYPRVKICGLIANFSVQKEINFSSFYEQNDQIIVGPY